MKRRARKFAPTMGAFLIGCTLLYSALPIAPASGSVSGACNEETATALGEEYDLNPFAPIVSTMSSLCGEFLGPGVESMIARAVPATCGGYAGWGAFRRGPDGSWQLIQKERNGQWDLTASGSDLEETIRVLGFNAPRCGKTETTKTRTWHWNGQKLVDGAWSIHPFGPAPWINISAGHFGVGCIIVENPKFASRSYREGITCVNSTNGGVAQKAELRPNGTVKTCHTHKPQGCGGGTPCGCAVHPVEVHPGEQVVKGAFTCAVTRTSVTCTVATGQGFTITANRMTRLSAPAARAV